jgi:hypothetical protein
MTFTFVVYINSCTTPTPRPDAGIDHGCKVIDTISGTYLESTSGGVNSLTWTMSSGTSNAIVGCQDPAHNSGGTAITDGGIDADIHEGFLPPRTVTYSVTQATLVLNPAANKIGSLSGHTEFTRSSS